MPLTELKIKNLKPKDKRYLVNDGQGLYIAVMPTGEKYWYVRTWENGKEKKRSLGRYPDVGLKEARELKYRPRSEPEPAGSMFGPVLEEWFMTCYVPLRGEHTIKDRRSVIDRLILPAMSSRPLKEITPREVFELVRPINDKSPVVGHCVKGVISAVFQYAIAAGLCEWNPAAQISGALTPYKVARHLSTVQTEPQARALMRSIDSYSGNPIFRHALLLLAYTFVRHNELRFAQWPELDLEKREWRIPAERMKMKREHVVPLSAQAAALFSELRALTRHPVWCFALPAYGKPIGSRTLNTVMSRMKVNATPHGFRGMASTLLNEHGFPPDVIERQLAHVEANAVRAAYNRAEYLDQRREMMQWWGDYLDGLRGL